MPLIQFELGPKTQGLFNRLVKAVEALVDVTRESQDQSTFEGGMLMFVVQDNHAAVNFSITAPDVTDAEGHTVPASELSYETTSTDTSAVTVVPGADQQHGSLEFGAPGQSSINVNVSDLNGNLLGAFGAQFTVTAGDPAAIVGGSINFEGLVEQ